MLFNEIKVISAGCTWTRRLVPLLIAVLVSIASQAAAQATNPPVITPASGVYSKVQTQVSMTMDAGATTRFTTDGSTPTLSSTVYSAPFNIGSTAVIKAISWVSGVPSTMAVSNILNDVNSLPVPRSGLSLWLQGGFGPVGTPNVTQWNDLSGTGNDTVQGTAANQPTVVSNAINGNAAVSFDGGNDYLSLTSGLANLTTGATVFGVIKPAGTGTATLFTSGNSGPSDMLSLETMNTQARGNFYNGTTSSSVASPTGAVTVNKFQLLDLLHSGSASASLAVNTVGVATGTVLNLTNTARSQNYVGADNTLGTFWNGQLAELLVYSRGLTVEERANVQAYLSSKFQLSTATATPPPVLNVATGTYDGPTQVAISAGPDSEIRFTRDGSTPSATSSPLYNGPFAVTSTETIKAISVANGIESSVVTAILTLNSTKWPAPSASDTRPLILNLQLPTVAVP